MTMTEADPPPTVEAEAMPPTAAGS